MSKNVDIRFNKDITDWDEKGFNDLFSEYNMLNDEKLPQYTVGKSGLIKFSDEKQRYDIKRHKRFYKNSLLLGIGTDEVGVSKDEEGCVSPIYNTFNIDCANFNTGLADYYISRVINDNKCLISHISTRRTYEIERKELSKLKVKLPALGIQKQIATLLSDIDSKIESQQDKIDKLKQVKSAMLVKMFPQEGQKVPEIRFKGFSRDWEERKFRDIFYYLSNNSLSRNKLFDEGFIKNIHYGDILVRFGVMLDISKVKLPYICEEGSKDYINIRLFNGDIVVADAAEDETVGKCVEISGISNELVLSGLHTIPCRPVIKFSSGYLGYYMNSLGYHNQLLKLMQGIKVLSLSKKSLYETHVIYPISLKEQQLIGNYFKTLDDKISLEQEKLEKLRNIKSSLLAKLIPAVGGGQT